MIDIRDHDGEQWLASDRLADKVVAVLLRLGDKRAAIRKILEGIAAIDPVERPRVLAELLVLAGLRKGEDIIRR